ncbi:TPA: hypothetical protein ACG0LC_003314 [Citrobacter sedlakii]
MTNVSAVEKMAELMQQMEENSPRVATLQYCLTQVAEKVGEAEKRNAELEARCAALAAENAGLKKFCKDAAFDADYEAELGMERGGFTDALNDIKTPATDAFLAEVRASGVDALVERRLTAARLAKENGHEITARDLEGEAIRARVFAMELRKGEQS